MPNNPTYFVRKTQLLNWVAGIATLCGPTPVIQIILCSPLEFAEFRMAGLPDFIVSIRAIACLPPTTLPQVFDMRVRCSTTRLHLLEFPFLLTSHLAGSSHFCLLRRKNGLDSHSPRAAYRLWYVPISLSTDNISSTQKRVDPPVGRQEDIVILARPTGHRRGCTRWGQQSTPSKQVPTVEFALSFTRQSF